MSGRIVVTVSADGIVNAHTEGVLGDRCLDYVAVLEDLLDAHTVDSSYTADYTRTATEVAAHQDERDVDRA